MHDDPPTLNSSRKAFPNLGDVSEFWRVSAKGGDEPAPRSAAVESGRGRLAVLSAVFLVAFGAIGWRLFDLCLDPPEKRAAAQHAAEEKFRADIVDRNGKLLARDLILYDISVNPTLLTDPNSAAEALAFALPKLDPELLRERFTSGRSFAYIMRRATPREADAVHALGLPSVAYHRAPQRAYPLGPLFSHVLGYTDVDNKGLAGMELARDRDLRSRSGEALVLSVDAEVQFAVRDVIEDGMAKYGAEGGIGLVMDAQNGEILSLVSLPDFDPNVPPSSTNPVMRNRATTSLYEMGSTFKTFTFAIGFEVGTLSLNERFDATHPLRISGRTIEDYHPQNRWLTPTEIFVHSSNIGAAQIALEYGGEKQRAYLEKLGLLSPSPIELPEVTPPLVQQRWEAIETATIAYGYGLAVSPVQLASGISALVNGGYYVTPTLIRVGDEHPERSRVISSRASDEIRSLLRINVQRGTGHSSDIPGYDVGGKTGTAKKQSGGGYRDSGRVSSFAAAFPMHAPKYVVLVMLDNPTQVPDRTGLAPTGGATAAPLSGLIIRRIAPILGMPPEGQAVEAQEVRTKKS